MYYQYEWYIRPKRPRPNPLVEEAFDLRRPKPKDPTSKAHSSKGPHRINSSSRPTGRQLEGVLNDKESSYHRIPLTNPIPQDLDQGSTSGHWSVPRFSCDRTPTATLTQTTLLPRVVGPMIDPLGIAPSRTHPQRRYHQLLGAIQQIVAAAIREQVAALAPARITTPSDVEAPEEEPGEAVPVPAPPIVRRLDIPLTVPQKVPAHWLAHLECLQKGLQDVQYQIGGAPEEERQGIPFMEVVMADELPLNCRTPAITEYDSTTDPVEHLAHFENAALLHRYTNGIKCRVFVTTFARATQQCSRKLRKTELSLFAVRQKDYEPLKEYLQRFNAAALEVPSATQEVKASAFSQGLLDGDFFKSLAKKPVSKFDALLARAAKYINMEDTQAAKKESRGEKRKDVKEEIPSKKPRTEFKEKRAPYQRINTVYTPLTVPITQALMAVEGKGLLARPRS
ncbi:UNVERIFIED_CONTAM: hypothetical protein Slati_1135300 [Sesamum latifolium]|uniref:Retrotransposon gag domain-containing protein n=1 Tax=Sesamum latifolium TaxID=2727402 RepID=A0AAW2XBM0_9LAMI